MRIRLILMVVATAIVASGCCTFYKEQVELYAKQLPKKGNMYYYDKVDADIRKQLVQGDASLACLVDSDKGTSTQAAPTPACKCSGGNPNTWEANCREWLDSAK